MRTMGGRKPKNGLSVARSIPLELPVAVPTPREGPRNEGYHPLDDKLAPLQARTMNLGFGSVQ